MTRKDKIKCGRDVTKLLERNGCRVRKCRGSHRVGYLPDGKVMTYHDHGESRPGMKNKITKALIAAGLLVAAITSFILAL